ncbi:SIR2 family protein [Exiguobacterium sp. s196]|uniref:SIR2 family protein n=1 Tax=Exiguobacterium sp. s196 TaxID=2751283 RepID=UPI001BE5FF84|nr:SIR2 family protein [Exiguobacterium sp. s196]
MDIYEFIRGFKNHPVLFIGTGISLRYLENSFSWDDLLKHVSRELSGNNELYYDIKSNFETERGYNYPKIASDLEKKFNEKIALDRDGHFKHINDLFYENMDKGINISRFKIYISDLLKKNILKEEMKTEIAELKKIRKNIGSVITTNYDNFIENIFDFNKIVGNEILLSNPYGSIYKIHGTIEDPSKIIITEQDYNQFNERYELIRAQLLSLFIHHPIIFLGYQVGDDNIKQILKTIFTYVNPNTNEAEEIRKNFLLVEYNQNSTNLSITSHDIDMKGFATIRINKLATDDFISIYRGLSELTLPVSAMDIRKVQSIVKEIYMGGNVKVSITEDIDSLKNEEKVLAIGSLKTIKYIYHTTSEMMENYFDIIEEENSQLVKLIDRMKIQTNQYFPIFGFSTIENDLETGEKLKQIQISKISTIKTKDIRVPDKYNTLQNLIDDTEVSPHRKELYIIQGILNAQFEIKEFEDYLKKFDSKKSTNYRKLLCVYDYVMYGEET